MKTKNSAEQKRRLKIGVNSMMSIVLKRAHFQDRRCVISSSFVSDGRWLLRKARIDNAPLFSDEQTVMSAFPTFDRVSIYETDVEMQRLWELSARTEDEAGMAVNRRTFIDTHISTRGHGGVVLNLYVGNGGEFLAFDNNYLELFGILDTDIAETTNGSKHGAVIFRDTILLMPYSLNKVTPLFERALPALTRLVDEENSETINLSPTARMHRLQSDVSRRAEAAQALIAKFAMEKGYPQAA